MRKHSLYILSGIILLILVLPIKMVAQESKYKFDFGASVGTSGYLGDANTSSLLKHPGIAADLNSRYVVNSRWALRAMLSYVSLSGNTAEMDNVLPDGKNYSFTSNVVDLGIRGEFNFFAYGIGETFKRLNRFTPYLTAGIGFCMAHSGNTTVGAPTIPIGGGFKYKIGQRLNIGLEFTMTKTFTDKVDGANLNDLTGIETSFIKNTDWFSKLTLGFTYEFGERCETCHYVD